MRIKIFTDYTFGKHPRDSYNRLEKQVNDYIEELEKEGYYVSDIKVSSWGDDGECESTIVLMYEKAEVNAHIHVNAKEVTDKLRAEYSAESLTKALNNLQRRQNPNGKSCS